jgi:hypothetical protein
VTVALWSPEDEGEAFRPAGAEVPGTEAAGSCRTGSVGDRHDNTGILQRSGGARG